MTRIGEQHAAWLDDIAECLDVLGTLNVRDKHVWANESRENRARIRV